MRSALLSLLCVLCACAGSDEPSEEKIRGGMEPPPDAQLDAAPDAAPIVDQGLAPDAALEPPFRRDLWLVIRSDRWGDGPRAHFVPAHRPSLRGGGLPRARDALRSLPGALPIVAWAGPESPGAELLQALRAEGPTGVLYDLRRRAVGASDVDARLRSDLSSLAAEHFAAANAARHEGAAILLIAGDPKAPELLAAVEHLATLPVEVALFAEVDPLDPVALPEWAVGLFPAGGYGFSLAGTAPHSDADDARALARWAGATERWLPRLMPPRFRRDGLLEPPDHGRAFRRALVLARRVIDPDWPVLLVDGVGGWADDRQLDPIEGEPTSAPMFLTQGLEYEAYGRARLDAVSDGLLGAAGGVPDLLAEPELIELHRDVGVRVQMLEHDERGLVVNLDDASGGQGRLEALLHGDAFRVPEGATLRYTRDDEALLVDLFFVGEGLPNQRLHDLLPRPEGEVVEVPLAAFAGARVEEVTLVYVGGRNEVRARVDGLRID